jgi:hypothetical protein
MDLGFMDFTDRKQTLMSFALLVEVLRLTKQTSPSKIEKLLKPCIKIGIPQNDLHEFGIAVNKAVAGNDYEAGFKRCWLGPIKTGQLAYHLLKLEMCHHNQRLDPRLVKRNIGNLSSKLGFSREDLQEFGRRLHHFMVDYAFDFKFKKK